MEIIIPLPEGPVISPTLIEKNILEPLPMDLFWEQLHQQETRPAQQAIPEKPPFPSKGNNLSLSVSSDHVGECSHGREEQQDSSAQPIAGNRFCIQHETTVLYISSSPYVRKLRRRLKR